MSPDKSNFGEFFGCITAGVGGPRTALRALKPRADFYASAHPAPDDVFLVIEVADSSLRSDRHIKVPLYARAGIRETWLVDLVNAEIEISTQPTPHGYQQSRRAGRGDRLAPLDLPEVSLLVDDIVG